MGTIAAAASVVKAARCITVCSERACFFCRVPRRFVSYLRYERSLLFFAARSDALVSPPPTLMRLSESRMPWVGIGARFELSVRELTPIHEISEDRRPYSFLGNRFLPPLSPRASPFPPRARFPPPR